MKPPVRMAASTRAEAAAQIRAIDAAFEELRSELELRPLRSDVTVGIEISGAAAYYVHDGRLKLVAAWQRGLAFGSSSSCDPGDARTRELEKRVQELEAELECRTCDVRVAFKDEKTLVELVTRVRDALRQNDLPRVLSSLLCEIALPTWGGGLRDVEVSGISSLARLLWSAWLAREDDPHGEQEREKAKQSWLDEDLSQGWVMVHSVSPGIKERVALFQSDLERLSAQRPGAREASASPTLPDSELERTHWMQELVLDLRHAAEQFHGSLAAGGSCIAPDVIGPAAASHAPPSPPASHAIVPAAMSTHMESPAAPPTSHSASLTRTPVVTTVPGSEPSGLHEPGACKAAPPRSSVHFL